MRHGLLVAAMEAFPLHPDTLFAAHFLSARMLQFATQTTDLEVGGDDGLNKRLDLIAKELFDALFLFLVMRHSDPVLTDEPLAFF